MDLDYNKTISNTTNYNFTNVNFTDLNWTMDYLTSFYGLTVKLNGTSPSIKVNSTDLSYIDLTYRYTIGPEIKSISNTNVNLLSATTPSTDINNATIILEGDENESTSMVVQMSDSSSNYLVKRDGVECGASNADCNFTQSNGLINFTNITLGSEHTITIEKIITAVAEAVTGAVTHGGGGIFKKKKQIEEELPKKIGIFRRWNVNELFEKNYMFFVFIGIFTVFVIFLIVRGKIVLQRKISKKVVMKNFSGRT